MFTEYYYILRMKPLGKLLRVPFFVLTFGLYCSSCLRTVTDGWPESAHSLTTEWAGEGFAIRRAVILVVWAISVIVRSNSVSESCDVCIHGCWSYMRWCRWSTLPDPLCACRYWQCYIAFWSRVKDSRRLEVELTIDRLALFPYSLTYLQNSLLFIISYTFLTTEIVFFMNSHGWLIVIYLTNSNTQIFFRWSEQASASYSTPHSSVVMSLRYWQKEWDWRYLHQRGLIGDL